VSVSVNYTYRGEICGASKSSLEQQVDRDKALVQDLWSRLKMYAAMTPPAYAKSECGTEYPWNEFLVEEFNRIQAEMEDYYWSIHHKEDCLAAMEENPDEVEDSF